MFRLNNQEKEKRPEPSATHNFFLVVVTRDQCVLGSKILTGALKSFPAPVYILP